MQWSEAFLGDNEPTMAQIDGFIASPLWGELKGHLEAAYGAKPKIAYSICVGQPGWNVKYQKGGKALCTLYPMPGYFIALVVIGERQAGEAELLMPALSGYTRALYARTPVVLGRWLMMDVKDAAVLSDVKALIGLRVKPKG